jgi:hypothetical protein
MLLLEVCNDEEMHDMHDMMIDLLLHVVLRGFFHWIG